MNKMDGVKSAALSLFAVKGYAATSMRDIADAVGLNKASLYFYTKSKRELYLAVVAQQLELLEAAIQNNFTAFKDEPLDMLLFQACRAIIVRPGLESILLWKRLHILANSVIDSDFKRDLRRIIADNHRSIRNFVNAFIAAKELFIDEERINRFVIAYETFVQGVLDWRLLNEGADIEPFIRSIWDDFWNGSRLV